MHTNRKRPITHISWRGNMLRNVICSAMLFCLTVAAQDIRNGSGKYGAVCAGRDYRAVDAGLQMLREGGTAADAAVATLLVLSIVDHGSFCIGAEIPFMIYDAANDEVKVLCGLGVAPGDSASIQWFWDNDLPTWGNEPKVSPVPGPISLFFKALELYGTMSFERVAQPALDILDGGGQSWYNELAATLRKLIETEQNTQGTRIDKLQAARDRFYKGDIADILHEWFSAPDGNSTRGFLRKSDLESYETIVEDPIMLNYNGYDIYKCDTWTQGGVLLQALAILKHFDLVSMGHMSAGYIHHCVEALKLAFADRDKYYGDPLFADVPIDILLSEEYNNLRYPLIDPDNSSTEVRPGDPFTMKAVSDPDSLYHWPGGTTTCCVADQYGNVVSATPSGNGTYSLCSELGIHFARRLRCFNTTPGHPNQIEPGKRPRITLTPTMVLKDGKPILAISVAGGDKQDQTTLNLLLNFIHFDMMPVDAVGAPRFETRHHENGFRGYPDRLDRLYDLNYLRVNEEVGADIHNALAAKGHDVSSYDDNIANPVMLYIDPSDSMMYAAGEPRADRNADALSAPVAVKGGTYMARECIDAFTVEPKAGGIEIAWSFRSSNGAEIKLYTTRGDLVYANRLPSQSGKQRISLNSETGGPGKTSGCYVAEIAADDPAVSRKFVMAR
ncbi:MAG: hypothetical protein GF401_07865 [Chitinivibrionales bacterium]|nr:hypothetical protein [Chitinivibrionales bacterium]